MNRKGIIVIIVLLIFNGLLLVDMYQSEVVVVSKDFTARASLSPSELTTKSTSITIGMIGDILLHNPLYTYENYDFAFEAVKDRLVGIDFLLANQESMPGGVELGLSGYPRFNSPKHIIRDLKSNGVDMLSIANNHTIDRGEKGIRQTHMHLKEYKMPYVGAYSSFEDQAIDRIVDVAGIKVGVLAYTYGTNGLPVPQGKAYLVSLIEKERMQQEIATLSKLVDVTVVSMHWGREYELFPSAEQEELAAFIAHAGATIIFGHHPHVLQKYADVGHAHVFYSIGNFYSAQQFDSTNIGGIAQVSATKTIAFGKEIISIHNPVFYPTAVVKNADQKYAIIPLSQAGKDAIYDEDWATNHVGVPTW